MKRLESMATLAGRFSGASFDGGILVVCGKYFSGGSFRECIPSIHSKIN